MRRRPLLTALGTVAFGGCAGRYLRVNQADSADVPVASASTPYRSSDPDENVATPKGIRVRNKTDRTRRASARITAPNGAQMAFADDVVVEANSTIVLEDLASRRGVYRVEVSVDADRTVHGWVVHEGWPPLQITLTETGVETRQRRACEDRCEPLGVNGYAADLPIGGESGSIDATLAVRNARATATTLSLSLRDEERTVLDRRYEVPPGVGFELRPVAVGGVYDLRVETPAGTWRGTWRLPEEPHATFTLTDEGVAVDDATGGDAPAEGDYDPFRGVHNVGTKNRDVYVTIRQRGETVHSVHYPVGPDTCLDPHLSLEPTLPLSLTARTRTGTSVAGTWTLRPPTGLGVRTDDDALALLDGGRTVDRRQLP